MEIMACRIGEVMGVPVPPAHVAVSHVEREGQATYGALIEWFYGSTEGYVEGSRLIGPLIDGFDYKTGAQNNLHTILALPLFGGSPRWEGGRSEALIKWARILTFDTVIGNTDRHPENWGVVFPAETSHERVRLSPAFDNGTSMSYELAEDAFKRFDDEAHARKYLTRRRYAKHHMRWSLDETRSMNFYELVSRLVSEYPETRSAVLGSLAFTEEDLRVRLDPLAAIPVDQRSRLTRPRLSFTLKLIMKRTTLLREALQLL